jgi:hypothetical protein
MSMGWNYVSELRLPTGLLFIPQVIFKYGEPRWNIDREKPRNSEKNPHTAWHPGANLGLRGERPVTNRLGHSTAIFTPSFPVLCMVMLKLTEEEQYPDITAGQSLLHYVPTTLGVQSWGEIISGGTRTKKVEYHCCRELQIVLWCYSIQTDEHHNISYLFLHGTAVCLRVWDKLYVYRRVRIFITSDLYIHCSINQWLDWSHLILNEIPNVTGSQFSKHPRL